MKQTANIATSVLANVANMMGRNTSEGFAAPSCARYIMMVTGISVSPEALMQRNITIASVAVSFSRFSSCNSCIAFRPIGVAALSSPRRFAEKFMNIDPVAGCPAGMPGKSLLKTGAASRANACTTPPRSPIFMMPIQSANTPVSPSDISKPVFAEANVALIISLNISTSPASTSRPAATTKATRKNPIHI